ncbi:MAG: RNB domain-containing ribonuclease [Actinomycetota bacterium]|nr:MAG: RNB domain-containing ribonuclease [Actinomycetota bacterium]
MKARGVAADVLRDHVGAIRAELGLPDTFSAGVEQAALTAARRPIGPEHVDRTDVEFVTLDPPESTDLDQAFTIERGSGDDLLLRYAIADVGWFVRPGDPVDAEAWRRGVTVYLPDGKVPLYPAVLSEQAASLLPGGPRPAVVFMVRVGAGGEASLDGVERAVVRSRAKLAYETVTLGELPDGFDELARRMKLAEDRRGAGRVEFPEQEVEPAGDDGYRLVLRPRLWSEESNAAMSLATNMAVADALHSAATGLYRVMEAPSERSVRALRLTAQAVGLEWPAAQSLEVFERSLTTSDPRAAAFLLAVRRAGGAASYEPYRAGAEPWHAAMAARYAHATAPLRRLADRYVVEAALAVASGTSPTDEVEEAFTRLPAAMADGERLANRAERMALDLVEALVLHGREGEQFEAVVVDEAGEGVQIQLRDLAVLARVAARRVNPGDDLTVRLVEADPTRRLVRFERLA